MFSYIKVPGEATSGGVEETKIFVERLQKIIDKGLDLPVSNLCLKQRCQLYPLFNTCMSVQ